MIMQIKDGLSNLTNIDGVINQTSQQINKAKELLNKAKDAKYVTNKDYQPPHDGSFSPYWSTVKVQT